MNKPRRTLAVILGVVLVAGAGGWYAGQQVQSPAEAAASHQAPPASLITVPVESRVLTNSVITHGTISFESPMPVNLSGAVGTASAGGGTGDAGGGAQRVTRAPGAGASVAEGTVFMEVSGRPVFVLRGAVPMYRTLGPGTKGDDVKQLNEALKRVGFDPGTTGESFTNGTATALKNWYRARGYDAKEPGAEDRHRLATLEQAVQTATDALTQARNAQRTPSAGSSETTGSTSSGSTGGSGGSGGSGGDGGKGGGTAGSTGGVGGAPPVDAASLRQRVTNAEKALRLAQQDLTDFKATYGTSLPVGELVFVASLPVRVDQVNVRPGDTPSGPVATVTGTGVRIQATVPAVDAQLLKPGMSVVLEDEAGGSRQTGKVEALGAGAETPAPGTGQNGRNGGSAGASGGAGTAPGGGTGGAGDTAGATGGPVPLRIVPDDTAALAARAGTSLRVTVEVGSTGTPVLAVPVAAVYTGADGQARVKVQRGNGKVDTAAVTLGLSAAGFVAVTPAAGQQLAAGDRVVVGEK